MGSSMNLFRGYSETLFQDSSRKSLRDSINSFCGIPSGDPFGIFSGPSQEFLLRCYQKFLPKFLKEFHWKISPGIPQVSLLGFQKFLLWFLLNFLSTFSKKSLFRFLQELLPRFFEELFKNFFQDSCTISFRDFSGIFFEIFPDVPSRISQKHTSGILPEIHLEFSLKIASGNSPGIPSGILLRVPFGLPPGISHGFPETPSTILSEIFPEFLQNFFPISSRHSVQDFLNRFLQKLLPGFLLKFLVRF